jgi:hypothetical protein
MSNYSTKILFFAAKPLLLGLVFATAFFAFFDIGFVILLCSVSGELKGEARGLLATTFDHV